MKLEVSLVKTLSHEDGGFGARLWNDDGETIDLADTKTAKAACNAAARSLRKAAGRFEWLGKQERPIANLAQERANKVRVKSILPAMVKALKGTLPTLDDCEADARNKGRANWLAVADAFKRQSDEIRALITEAEGQA